MLNGVSLTCSEVAAAAREQAQVRVSAAGRDRVAAAARVTVAVAARRPVYGRTTGRSQPGSAVRREDTEHAGLRLLRLRSLLGSEPGPAARIQDPYGYRALPQVHGAAVDAVRRAEHTVTGDINVAGENPLVDTAGSAVWHNGNFHTAYLALALDSVRAALFQTAALSAARLGTLVEPAYIGLTPFLAGDSPPSSGIMILEYVARRRGRRPQAGSASGAGRAVLSRWVEEHAGFATQSARATKDVIAAYRQVLACELVASLGALRMAGVRPIGPQLREAFAMSAAVLSDDTRDQPLGDDLAAAHRLLPQFTELLAVR
jgi:histidine ammonia-lyase